MASSSTYTDSSPRQNQSKYHVFLSFRGEDTRHSFTDHLYTALKQASIHTFRDDYEIKRGRGLGPEIVKAIQNSRASIVVLSQNYAKSTWCLEELSLILQQKRTCNHFVLPVFYQVDPSDVRNQRHSFAIESNERIELSNWTEVNVNRWTLALTEVANLTGMVASGSESKFIANIVDKIRDELDLKLISTPAHLTGMVTRAEEINLWLKDEQSNTSALAICGMGGSGKTTLAQHVYNSNKQNFESSCFLEEIGEHFKETHALLGLQKKLLTYILGGKIRKISCVGEGTTKIREVLQMKKVLIVLDGIGEKEELEALLGTIVFQTQSKIILTTRTLNIHSWFESISWKCHVHKLKLLNDHESLEVLSCHAFGSKLPLEGFSELAVELAQYCGGNPLALKVLGSSLFVSSEDPYERNSLKEMWRSRLNSLSSLKGDLDCKIQCVLRKSFDSLSHASYRELFLNIVVFFVGEDEDYVVKILEHDWNAKAGIPVLINRCLLTISSDRKLMMHQLLQDMGTSIVHEESKDRAKHARVWCSDEAYHVLTKGDGSETIEGLTLDNRKLKKGTNLLSFKTDALANMRKLKLLQLKYVKLSGCYKNFPELRWLCWHGCNMNILPRGLLMSSLLVAIDMTNGNLKTFEPPMVLYSLKSLNLTSCHKLVSICKLFRLPNIETLILWECSNLTHVCKTIEGLQRLALLNLASCEKLWKVSWNNKLVNQQEKLKALFTDGEISEQPLFSLPQSLKYLFLDYCNLKYRSDLRVVFNGPLFGISLRGNLFEFMPSNIDVKMLRVLNLDYCINLNSILCLPSTLEELYTYDCKSLEKVTFQSARFRLRKFGYKGCFKLSQVQGLFKLVAIKELDEADLGHMNWVKAYRDHKVDLVGDEFTQGRIWHAQLLYEYGIRSTYLQGVNDQSMMTFRYMSTSRLLSFRVSLHRKKQRRVQGVNVSCVYRLLGSKDKDSWMLFMRIRNKTKGVTWIYNPMVYCKPKVDKDAIWLSYWPIGNILDDGDDIKVSIHVEKGMIVTKCSANLVYMNYDEVEQQEKLESKMMKMEEVIGGDLSEFEVTTGVYYLCRRDFFKSASPDLIKRWFGDTIPYTELQGWRKCHQSQDLDASCMELEYIEEHINYTDTFYKGICLGNLNSKSDIGKIKKVVSKLVGVDLVDYHDDKLFVLGSVDSKVVEACVREFDKTVKIITVDYNVELPKRYHMKMFINKLRSMAAKYSIYK